MLFEVKARSLPHDGIIPGARGHKKVVIPKGRQVFVIMYESSYFWAAYLDKETATTVARTLEETTFRTSRRHIKLEVLLAWNFKSVFPKRISRPKGNLIDGTQTILGRE